MGLSRIATSSLTLKGGIKPARCLWGSLNYMSLCPNAEWRGLAAPFNPEARKFCSQLHLKEAAPIQGIVTDEHGNPVAGAIINANAEYRTVSDSEGRFTIHGFGPNSHFQFQLPREGYVFINWGVNVRDDGIRWHRVGDAMLTKSTGLFRNSQWC